ncbi:MAG: hypothetical protein RR911_03380 [Oscillospiraceae bacterium]
MIKFFKDNSEPITADDFITNKVQRMLEQSINENNKRRKIEDNVYDEYSEVIDEEFRYLGSVNELSQFPRYSGRGNQEHAPDIKGSLADDGFTSMTLWYCDVTPKEVKEFKELLISNGFLETGNEFIKKTTQIRFYIMIEYSEVTTQLRLYHTITKLK